MDAVCLPSLLFCQATFSGRRVFPSSTMVRTRDAAWLTQVGVGNGTGGCAAAAPAEGPSPHVRRLPLPWRWRLRSRAAPPSGSGLSPAPRGLVALYPVTSLDPCWGSGLLRVSGPRSTPCMSLFPRELPSLLRHQGSPVCTLGCRHHCHLRVSLPIEVQDRLALNSALFPDERLFLHSLSACLSGGCFPHPLHPVPWFPVLPIRPHQPTCLHCYTSVAAAANPLASPPTTLPGATDFRVHPQAICPPRPGAVLEQRATGRLGGIPHATATRRLGAPRVPRPPDGSGRPACPQHAVPQLLSLALALRRPHAGAQCFASSLSGRVGAVCAADAAP